MFVMEASRAARASAIWRLVSGECVEGGEMLWEGDCALVVDREEEEGWVGESEGGAGRGGGREERALLEGA